MSTLGKKRTVIFGLCFALLICSALAILFWNSPKTVYADASVTEFLSTFTAGKGETRVENGELCYTIGGKRSYAEVSLDRYSAGSQWYVKYLSTRNTVMLRAKNQSSADSMTVYFKTKTKDWSEENTVTVPLQKDGEYHTYFIELTANANADGELRGLRFAPQAESGKIYINHVSFEREDTSYDYAGEILSCTTDGNKVTVRGKLSAEYAGRQVTLYRTLIDNMDEELKPNEKFSEVRAEGESFTFEFPYHDGEVTALSSHFIAAVDDVKVDKMFAVENWRDQTENPYAFELPSKTVKVSDYGAKGDAFTDDTAAIQRAIDEISASGGGTVLVEGDTQNRYGKRYVVTTVWMKDNVELRIEEGAMLWQSWRDSDYTYPTQKGHDNEAIKWGHNGLAINYPLVYSNRADNIRITGGGTLRLCDTGNQSRKNGYKPAYSEYCKSTIHLVPIGLYDSTNVEVTDITILRTNCYHTVVYDCQNVYLGNITMTEDNCLSGDGFSIGVGSKNVIIDRCFLYTDDDAIVLIAQSINEPRGVTWWHAKKDGEDNRIRNITLRHSAVTPGNIIVLITWGVDASDMTWQAMNGFYVYDNILGNYGASVAAMNLCPSQGYPFGDGGSVPVNNVVVMNNSYRGPISNLNAMVKTNWVVDCDGVEVASDFVDAAFSDKLGYWEYGGEYKQNVDVSGNTASLNFAADPAEKYGKASLYQGLYLQAGKHTVSADVVQDGAKTRLFVKDSLGGEEIAVQNVSESGRVSVDFEIKREGVYLIGVDGGESVGGSAKVSAFALQSQGAARAEWFTQNFESEAEYFDSFEWQKKRENENTYLAFKDGLPSADVRILGDYKRFDLKFEFNAASVQKGGSVFVRFGEGDKSYYLLRYTHGKGIALEYCKNGVSEPIAAAEWAAEENVWYQWGVRCGDEGIRVFVDGTEILSSGALKAGVERSKITFGFGSCSAVLDNVCVSEEGKSSFGKSEHWTEKPVDPVPPEGGDQQNDSQKTGCGGEMAFGFAAIACPLLAAAAFLIQKRRKNRE